jgi:hypothetical protein
MRSFFLFVGTCFVFPWISNAQIPAVSVFIVEDFEADVLGELPAKWFNRDGDYIPAMLTDSVARQNYPYRIMAENGNKFLRYEGSEARHLMVNVRDLDSLDIEKTPTFSWKWRVWDLPVRGNEDVEARNDVAASVYVLFETSVLGPKVLRYTWSTELPALKSVSKNLGRHKILVLQSGSKRKGEWITEKRNLAADYKQFFGGNFSGRPLAILILSDANSTNSFAKADYDDFLFLSN